MAGITQEVHPCAVFFNTLPESFCILSMKGRVQRIGKSISMMAPQKVKNCQTPPQLANPTQLQLV